MQGFYKVAAITLAAAVGVLAYDVLQRDRPDADDLARVRLDPASGVLTFWKPGVSTRIVYASLMGPGEPAMRISETWISLFEELYSDRLAANAAPPDAARDDEPFVRATLAQVAPFLPEAGRRLSAIAALADAGEIERQTDDLEGWLTERQMFVQPPGPKAPARQRAEALRGLVEGLQALSTRAAAAPRAQVRTRRVAVERRWQGRWVLSANRPRFLTGRDVPDIICSDKMELLALVQDGYAVPMDAPLPGAAVSPLDGPDTWGQPARTWRQAFIAPLLEDGKYAFLDGEAGRHVFLIPTACSAFCIFYNQVLFQKAGIEKPPRTWPEFMAACGRLKAAGIYPMTGDRTIYADYWMRWLIFRSMGPEAWEQTITGVPAGAPPPRRKCVPPWTGPAYQAAFAQIQLMREKGYFDPDFKGSTFPAAQRGFAAGGAAMMICGTWLASELSGYKDIRSGDRFKLGCFSFPQWPGGRERDQRAAHAQVIGMMICRQGRATVHAVELAKFLCAREHPDLVYRNDSISCMADADFPPALQGIEEDFRNATAIYSRMPEIYARRFNAAAIVPLFNDFFLKEKGEPGFMPVDEFLRALDRRNARYLAGGGEEGYE